MAANIREYKARLYALRGECGEGWADWARRLCVDLEDMEALLGKSRVRVAELESALVRVTRERDETVAEAERLRELVEMMAMDRMGT